ncbi:hypothetical protein EI94DRAFT_1814490 [Lactarius quietus]|nr:hypothetical protein EI94DRAFT_1814490 [Lactarius quietus]
MTPPAPSTSASVPSPSADPGPAAASPVRIPRRPTAASSELSSLAPTEIALGIHRDDIGRAHPCAESRDHQASIFKVRDFAHESLPSHSEPPGMFEPLPMNHGMLSDKTLPGLIKVGWLSMYEVAKHVHVRKDIALA